jgi:hypothetical protein
MSRQQPSEAQLEAVARTHVSYELNTMAALAGAARPADGTANHALLDTALFEAFMIHVRNLDEFLRIKRSPAARVAAVDYCHEEWRPTPPLRGPQYGELCERVFHITTTRIGAPGWDKDGDKLSWALPILRGFDSFVGQLGQQSPERAIWFAQGLSEAYATLELAKAGAFVFARIPWPIAHPSPTVDEGRSRPAAGRPEGKP